MGVSTADPQVLHHILKFPFPSYPKGPRFYPLFADLLGNGILNCDGALWRFQRKVASHVFTSNSLKDFMVQVVDAKIAGRLLPALDRAHHLEINAACVDLQALLMLYTFNTICQLTFGADPACLDISKLPQDFNFNGNTASTHTVCGDSHAAFLPTPHAKVPDHFIQGFVQGFPKALQVTAERFLIPELVWKIKRFFKIGSEKKLIDATKEVHNFTGFVIEQGKRDIASGEDRKDLLARFMGLTKEQEESHTHANELLQEGMKITDSLLRDVLLSFILAGCKSIASGSLPLLIS